MINGYCLYFSLYYAPSVRKMVTFQSQAAVCYLMTDCTLFYRWSKIKSM